MVELPVLINVPASVRAAYSQQRAEGAIKTAEDLARYRQIIMETNPDLIIECGTWAGGSAVWFSQFAEVLTIDIAPNVSDEIRATPGITWLTGSSTDPDIVAVARMWTHGTRTMVVLDSDHRAEHVRAEIAAYGDMVSQGCYMVVEDGIVRWMNGENYDGPLNAIEEFLYENVDWERDVHTEQLFPVSMHPAGWLRRRS